MDFTEQCAEIAAAINANPEEVGYAVQQCETGYPIANSTEFLAQMSRILSTLATWKQEDTAKVGA